MRKESFKGIWKYGYYLLKLPNYIRNIGLAGTAGFIRCAFAYRLHIRLKEGTIRLHSSRYRIWFEIRKNTSDIEVFGNIILEGSYDFIIRELKNSIHGGAVVDLGANTGLFSCMAAAQVQGFKILSVEPQKENYDMLVRNVENKCLNAGIWNKCAYLKIEDTGYEYGFVVRECTEEEADVKAVDMNFIISKYGIHKIDLLKIDIEGSEYELFDDSCQSWIGLVENIIIEIHDHIKPGCYKRVSETLKNNGFYEQKNNIKEQNVYAYSKRKKGG